MKKISVSCSVNGELLDFEVAPNRSLLDALRTEMGLTGTKKGCDVGECGSCTILFNGQPTNACRHSLGLVLLAMPATRHWC